MKRLFYLICVCMAVLMPSAEAADGGERQDYSLLCDLGVVGAGEADSGEKLSFEKLAELALAFCAGGREDLKADAFGAAADAGFIEADAKGDVSAAAAARAVMYAVGYRRGADAGSNYYLKLALEKGLFDGVSVSDSNAVTVGEAAALFENAMDMETMRSDSTGLHPSGKTAAEDLFGLHIADGVFWPGDAVGYSARSVQIGGVQYEAKKRFDGMAGKMVRAYVNDDGEALSINGGYFRNEICVISANDIERVENNVIYFTGAGGRVVSRKIAADAEEVYNGRMCGGDSSDLDISNGFITLIRRPGESAYGAVIIKQYDMLLAGGRGSGVIYDACGSGASVRTDSPGTEVCVFLGEEEISAADIKKYDVLLLYRTKDKEKLRIEVVRNTVSGRVSASGDDYIKIDRRIYVKSAYYKEYAKELSAGEEAELILDGEGLAVGFKRDDTAENYGYFMGLYRDEEEDIPKIRLLSADGTVEHRALRDKLQVDGVWVTAAADTGQLHESLKTLVKCDTNGEKSTWLMKDYVYQLIIYGLDSEGKIRYIDTALELGAEDKNKELTLDAYINANKRFKTDPMQFVDSFGLSPDSTKIFYVPYTDNIFDESGNADKDKRGSASLSDYTVITTGVLKNDQDDITACAYNVSGGGTAKAVVVENKDVGSDAEFTNTSAGLFILCEVIQGIDENDERICILKGMLDGKEAEFTVSEEKFGRMEGKDGEKVFVTPKKGDIMQIKADSDNRILSYSTRYSGRGNINYYGYIGNNIWTQFGNFVGYVYDKDDYGFCIVSDVHTLANKRFVMNKGVKKVYIYDMETDTVSAGDLTDIASYKEYEYGASRIYARTAYGVVNTVVIYINEEENR